MKHIKITLLAIFLSGSFVAQAQQPEKPEKGKGKFIPEERIPKDPWPEGERQRKEQEEKEKSDKRDKDNKVNKGQEKDHPGKGNAYGRDKEVQGREFGQQRAAEARAKAGEEAQDDIEDELERHEREVTDADNAVDRMRQRIEEARQKILKKREEGSITEQEFRNFDERIKLAQQKVQQLEDQVVKERERADVSRRKLKTIVSETKQD